MKKLTLLISIVFFVLLTKPSFAQMMGNFQGQQTPPSQNDIAKEQSMQDAGQKIYENLQSGKITCQNLTNSDFEKLGEYFMGQAAGSTQNHVYWDQRMEQMMGEQADSQMHVVWGQRGSACYSNAQFPPNTTSFVPRMVNGTNNMMGFGYGMTNTWGGNILCLIFGSVIFVDLILAGIFLLKRIKK